MSLNKPRISALSQPQLSAGASSMTQKLSETELIFSPNYNAMKIHDGVERKLHAFLISAQDEEDFTLTWRLGIFDEVCLCMQTTLNVHRNVFLNTFYAPYSAVMVMTAMIPH
jgi:hypothetical protein